MKFLLILAAVCGLQIANAKEIVLTTYNVCNLQTEVDDYSMAELKGCIAEKVVKRGKKSYPIYIYVNSPGGSVYDGLKFIEFIKSVPNVHTVTSFAASMAAGIVQATPGKRYAVGTNIMMFHRARGSVSGQIESGEVEQRLALWKSIIRSMEEENAKRLGLSVQDYKDKIVNEWWTFGSDSVAQNTVDEIVTVKCSHALAAKKTVEKVITFFGEFEETIYACPLLN